MKKYSLVFCLILVIGLLPISNVYGSGYLLLTAGGGGQANAGSIGGEGGWIGQNFLLGIGFSVADTSETGPINPYGVSKDLSDEWEIYGAAGIKIVTDLFLTTTAGYSQQTISTTLRAGGEEMGGFNEEPAEEHFTASGQLRYVYKNLIVGVGYHNRRGIIGGIGFRF